MSIMRCEQHQLNWDSDKLDDCPECENEPEKDTTATARENGIREGWINANEHDYWNEMYAAACEERRPFVQLKPRLFLDGNQWCALYGENIQDGVAAFGDSPEYAAWNFDRAWCEKIGEPKKRIAHPPAKEPKP